MAKSTTKKKDEKKEVPPTVTETTSIILKVPNALYFNITDKVTKAKRQGDKITIHDQVIDDLYCANPNIKKPKK